MIRKLAIAFAVSAAFASPALATQRGLPESPRCSHCLPTLVTGGPAAKERGRVVGIAHEETSVTMGAQRVVARGLTRPGSEVRGRVVVNAECHCAKGTCPKHA